MSNKLDLLAQKEQQLRLLNDQLDKKKTNLLAAKIEAEESQEDFEDSQLNKEEDYDGDDFEQSTHKSKTLKGMALSAKQLDEEEYEKQPAINAIAEEESKDQYEQYGEENGTEEMLGKILEQDKTIQFQKAKIAALQIELEETLGQLAQKQASISDETKQTEKVSASAAEKKNLEKINALNLQVTKLKTQLAEQQQKTLAVERQLKERAKELDSGDLELRKNVQD